MEGHGEGGWRQTAHSYYKPALETGLGILGGGIGAPTGPVGIAYSTGLGLAMALALSKFIDRQIGYAEPPESVMDSVEEVSDQLAEGITWAVTGEKLFQLLKPVGTILAPHVGKIGDTLAHAGKPLSRLAGKQLYPGEETVKHIIDYAQHFGDEIKQGSTNLYPLAMGVLGPTLEDYFRGQEYEHEPESVMDRMPEDVYPEERMVIISAPRQEEPPPRLPSMFSEPAGTLPSDVFPELLSDYRRG